MGAGARALRWGMPVLVALSLGLSGGCAATAPLSPADQQVLARVRAALDADPYFYAEHTQVRMEHGAVVLTGEVYDNRAMFDAVDAAQRAAPDRKVINELSIEKMSTR